MSKPDTPRVLPENAGLAFAGERSVAAARIPPQTAERMLAVRNPHGKPNADVVRRLVSATDPRHPVFHWQVDFPSDMSEHEASLYALPFQHVFRGVRPHHGSWWRNHHANPRLRAALARRDRYLATPIGADPPAFVWFESSIVPGDTLLTVARDDDFIHGVLQSRPFAVWWRQRHSRRTPTRAVASFPFPWPPPTALSALTAVQEEQRHAIARAARPGDPEPLNAAVSAAYGWPADLSDAELLAHLSDLHRRRVASL